MLSVDDLKAAAHSALLPQTLPTKTKPATGQFIKGPVPLQWVRQAFQLSKPALGVGLTLWLLRGIQHGSAQLRIDRSFRNRLGLSADQARRGAHALERAGLVKVTTQGRGRCLVVQLAEVPSNAFDLKKRTGSALKATCASAQSRYDRSLYTTQMDRRPEDG